MGVLGGGIRDLGWEGEKGVVLLCLALEDKGRDGRGGFFFLARAEGGSGADLGAEGIEEEEEFEEEARACPSAEIWAQDFFGLMATVEISSSLRELLRSSLGSMSIFPNRE